MLTQIMQQELRRRRSKLLAVIPATELANMHRKVTGSTAFVPIASLRIRILNRWSDHAEEIQRWCNFTITGEAVL